MKVLMLSWEYPPRIVGGISRVVYHLAKELGAQEHEVTVITCQEGTGKEFEKEGNVKVYRVEPFYIKPIHFINSVLQMNLALFEKAVELLRMGESFDLLHLHDWLVAFAGKSIVKIFSIPQICTIHSTEYGRNTGIHNDIQSFIGNVEEKMVTNARQIIVNSLYMKNEVHGLFGCPIEKIHVIPNGIEADKFTCNFKDMDFRRRFAADGEKLVFFVGRLVNEKGVHVLMNAIPQVLSRYGYVRFIIAGTGPEKDSLQKRAVEMGIDHKVAFTGYITDDELLKIYKCADMAVFPSLYEPFGIVALEGMVANLPVIVSEAGGLNEIVTHRFNGMKFQTGRSDLLADCILELLTNTDLVEDITKNAWNTIIEKYHWPGIVQKTVDVYHRAVRE